MTRCEKKCSKKEEKACERVEIKCKPCMGTWLPWDDSGCSRLGKGERKRSFNPSPPDCVALKACDPKDAKKCETECAEIQREQCLPPPKCTACTGTRSPRGHPHD